MLLGVRVQVCGTGTKSLWGWGMGRGQTPSPCQTRPKSFKERGSEPHGGCWVPLPTADMADALHGQKPCTTEGSEMELGLELDLGFPKLPTGSQDLSCPRAQPQPRAGQAVHGSQAAGSPRQTGISITGGANSQPPGWWVFLSPFLSLKPACFQALFSP